MNPSFEYDIYFPHYYQLLNQEAQRVLHMWNFQYEVDGHTLRVSRGSVTFDQLLAALHSSGYQTMKYRKTGQLFQDWTNYKHYRDDSD